MNPTALIAVAVRFSAPLQLSKPPTFPLITPPLSRAIVKDTASPCNTQKDAPTSRI
jgi:hypothetical protein